MQHSNWKIMTQNLFLENVPKESHQGALWVYDFSAPLRLGTKLHRDRKRSNPQQIFPADGMRWRDGKTPNCHRTTCRKSGNFCCACREGCNASCGRAACAAPTCRLPAKAFHTENMTKIFGNFVTVSQMEYCQRVNRTLVLLKAFFVKHLCWERTH